MNELSLLKNVLVASVKKHGDKPLTLSHLINIISLIEKSEDKRMIDNERLMDEALTEIYASECGDRS